MNGRAYSSKSTVDIHKSKVYSLYLSRLLVSKTKDWTLAVQTLGVQQGSFSRLLLRESLSHQNSDCPWGKSEASPVFET